MIGPFGFIHKITMWENTPLTQEERQMIACEELNRERKRQYAADTAKRRSTTPPTDVNAKTDNREDQK